MKSTTALQTLCIRGSNVPLLKQDKVYLKTTEVPNIGIYTCRVISFDTKQFTLSEVLLCSSFFYEKNPRVYLPL